MKKLLLIGIALVLIGCQTEEVNDAPPVVPNVINASDAGADKISPENLARLGEDCGPSVLKICASGLSCQFEGMQQTVGKCLPVAANPDMECEETQAPVCGLIENNKNGYLNECFARRFGAIVLNEGLCRPGETNRNNCEARAYSIGNCQNPLSGAYFNPEIGECEAVSLVGCESDIPFRSVEMCNARCSQID